MTRNLILGIPKEGLSPNSEEAAQLHAAEAFVSDIQQEILAYDIANAKAFEAYTRRWWSRVPYFGRHAKAAIEQEAAEAAAAAAAPTSSSLHASESATATASCTSTEAAWQGSALEGLDAAAAAEAVAGTGAAFLHKQKGTTARGSVVERTSALDQERLRQLLAEQKKAGAPTTGTTATTAASQRRVNAWLFKRQHPGWIPLMQRWWVPWVCVVGIAVIWTPDVWKLRTLYLLDYQYAQLRQSIHKSYWRLTMRKEDYDALMADIEAQRPRSVKSTECPF